MLFKANPLGESELKVIQGIYDIRKALRFNLAKPNRWQGLLRRNTFARAVQGSNSIEGYVVTKEDAIAAIEGEEPLDAERGTWQAITGYRNAMTFVLQLAKDPAFRYNEGFLRSLHFMMIQHDLSKNPGNWRPGAIYVRNEAKQVNVYEGPPIEIVPGLIDELIEYLNTPSDTPELVRGAMAHLNFVMIHPFSDGNGRMARCLQTLVLVREGILEAEFCSIEEYLGRNTQDYYDVLADTGKGAWHPENSTSQWIRFCLTAHYRQATTHLMRSQMIAALWNELEVLIKAKGLPDRVIFAIADAAVGYRVRNSSYRHLAEVSDILASRDLKAAVDAGLLITIGERRGRGYLGSESIRNIFTRIREEIYKPIPDPFIPETRTLPFEGVSA